MGKSRKRKNKKMNIFFYTFIETIITSKFILLGCFLGGLFTIYVLIIRLLTGQKLFKKSQEKINGKIIFKKALNKKNNLIFEKKPKNIFLKKWFKLYQQSHFKISWNKLLLNGFLLNLVLFSFGFFYLKSFSLGVIFYLLGIGFLGFFLLIKSNHQKKKIIKQLPSFLQAMASTLQAGYSIPNAFLFLENEVENPLKKEIQKINQKLSLKVSLEKALLEFSQMVDHSEIYFFAESTVIQLKTGGNLIKLFKKISYLIEEKLKLERDIKSFTSQGKLSGILIAGLWPISLLFFYFFSPQHAHILFYTITGKSLLIFSLFLETIGFFFIWKIIKVKI